MELPLNKIINEDCLIFMKTLPDKCIDCVITSPPYNVSKNNMTEKKYQGYQDDMTQEEYYLWTKKILDELLRTSHTIFYNFQMLSDNKRTFLKIFGEYSNYIKDIIIWNKNTAAPAIEPGVMTSKFEFIMILSDDEPEKRKFHKANFRGTFTNVIEGGNASGNKFADTHKATFPQYLPDKIITNFTNENDIIFDPFMGIGTTAMSAKQLKRNYIGCEISPEYCKIAEDRIKSISNTLF